jgi:acyl-CoA synthetase (NDP forming)
MNKNTLRTMINSAVGAGRRALSAPEAQQLCDAYGIPTPKQALAKTAAEATKIAARLGFPVVLKIVSDDILHKTEAGGVIVGLDNPIDVRRAFEQLVKNAKGYKKNASIQGVQVQQMLRGGQEVMVGAVTDPTFGKMIAFGLGACWSKS